MIQSFVVLLALLIAAAFIQANAPIVHLPMRVALPGMPGVYPSLLRSLIAVAAALVLTWLAGMVDLRRLRGRVHLLEEAVQAKDEELEAKDRELMRIKSAAYDKQEPALADIRAQLEAVVQEVKGMVEARHA